jgi:hypothetical protein
MPCSFPIGRVGVFVLTDTLCHKQAMFAQFLQPAEHHESVLSGGWVANSRAWEYLILAGILFCNGGEEWAR